MKVQSQKTKELVICSFCTSKGRINGCPSCKGNIVKQKIVSVISLDKDEFERIEVEDVSRLDKEKERGTEEQEDS